MASRLRNDLYCVEWDVKLYYTIPLQMLAIMDLHNCLPHRTFDHICDIRFPVVDARVNRCRSLSPFLSIFSRNKQLFHLVLSHWMTRELYTCLHLVVISGLYSVVKL